MTDIEKLLAIEEIKQLKARYFRCVDTKDWARLKQVFAPDATLDVSEGLSARDPVTGTFDRPLLEFPPMRTNEEVVAHIAEGIQHMVTVHHGHMPEIRVTSDTTASGIWSMEDKLRSPTGQPFNTMHGYGHYHETYRKVAGAWCIASLKLTRLRIDMT